MSDLDKMKEVQERINKILEDFKVSKVLPKSKIMKYYRGLEVTYDEFVTEIEKALTLEFNEDDAKSLSEILEDF